MDHKVDITNSMQTTVIKKIKASEKASQEKMSRVNVQKDSERLRNIIKGVIE